MIKKGDQIEILRNYQDKGDDELIWIAVDDEEKGRVMIKPLNTGLVMAPHSVVQSEWVKKKLVVI